MDFFDAYQIEGFAEFIASLFALVPVGFALGMLSGFLAFAIFGIVRLVKGLMR